MRTPTAKAICAILGALMFIFGPLFPLQAQAASPQGFSAQRAYDHVKYLVQKVGPRPAGSKAEIKAAQYIYYNLEQSGWKVHEQPFSKVVVHSQPVQITEPKIELINSQNIVAELPGTKADTIVLGAHYDTADINAPGAVDNASGVGVLLELARILALEPHEETYQMVFFGAEEQGLVGSAYFASQSDLSAVNWMLNLDMVGTPVEIDVAGKKSAPPELVEKIAGLTQKSRVPFHLSQDSLVMNRESDQGGSSDFSSFLDQGIPALGLGIAGRPAGYYHRPEDTIEHISLETLQKVGEYLEVIVRSVRLDQTGPRTWDENYLSFQFGAHIFLLPSYGIRIFYLVVFLFAGALIVSMLRRGARVKGRDYFILLAAVLLTGLILTALSGSGEMLWLFLKKRVSIWYAYPGFFILARLGIIAGSLAIIGRWLPKLPLPREPDPYWLTGEVSLLVVGLLLALIRIDLAFPIVFWLFCFSLLRFFPHIALAVLGPLLFYRFHWEMLNSSQWQSYYYMLHRYFPVFLIFYTVLMAPFLLALFHVAARQAKRWRNLLNLAGRPAAAMIVISILFVGLVPAYNSGYPQVITIQEDWSGSGKSSLSVVSPDNFSRQLARDLHVPFGAKTATLPSLSKEPPVSIEANVLEKQAHKNRDIELNLQFKYLRDPYLVKLKLESARPFRITAIDEFCPLNKLPRKVRLTGKLSGQGNYVLTLERTPPQRNSVKMSIEAESTLKCTAEVTFPDPDQSFQIKNRDLSVDYKADFTEKFEF